MSRRVDAVGASLEQLICLAIPLCRAAQHQQCPRTGPGCKPLYDLWKLAVMIVCAVMKKRKSKSAQYRWIVRESALFMRLLKLPRLPARSSFFDRYRQVWRLVQSAIALQGRLALREHVADASVVAADKSLLHACGPQWHPSDRKKNVIRPGTDQQANWGYSDYCGWVYGYSFEVVVSATKESVVMPLLASVDQASASEHTTFAAKIQQLPQSTRDVLADSGYDDNNHAQLVQQLRSRRRFRGGSRRACRSRGESRRFLCPPQRGWIGKTQQQGKREQQRQDRLRRHQFLCSPRGQALYSRRSQTVEPFNGIFKQLFELEDHVWHRGLDNNRTQLLCAIFAYQLLIRWHWKHGRRDAQIQYILDGL